MTDPNSNAGENDPDNLIEHTGELDEILASLDEIAAEDPAEALATLLTLPETVRAELDVQLTEAHLYLAVERLDDARKLAERILNENPQCSDAHHLLGDALEDLGELEAATTHFLEALRIDKANGAERSSEEVTALLDSVGAVLQRTIGDLPAQFGKVLSDVPLVVERFPTEDEVRQGLDPRLLGLFDGATHGERQNFDTITPPTRIVLFAENLAIAFPDPDEFEAEVETSVLQEVGHFSGLDEDELHRIGLG